MKKRITEAKKILSVIARGGNQLGTDLAKVLLKNGSKVIIVDDYNKDTKDIIASLKKHGEVEFVDIKKATSLYGDLERIDYSYYILYDLLLSSQNFGSKQFLNESNVINSLIEQTARHDGTFSLITTIELNKKLALFRDKEQVSAYSNIEFQRYAETLTAEYYDKSNSDVRIVRLGTVLGEGYNLSLDPLLFNLISDSVKKDHLTIYGEGLDTHHIISSKDAIFAILKLSFSEKTKGEVISVALNSEFSTLALAYKIIELNPTATNIQFQKSDDDINLLRTVYIPAPNASEYGWTPKESIEKILAQEIENFFTQNKKTWQASPLKSKEISGQSKSNLKTIKTPLGRFFDKIKSAFVNEEGSFNIKGIAKFLGLTIFTGLFFYFILAPILLIGISTGLLYYELRNISTEVSDTNITAIAVKLNNIEKYCKNIDQGAKSLDWAIPKANKASVQNLTGGIKMVSQGANKLYSATYPLIQYAAEFEPAQNFDNSGEVLTTKEYRQYLSQIEQNKTTIQSSINDLKLAKAMIEEVDIAKMQPQLDKLNTALSQAISFGEIAPLLPEVLGTNERKTYLFVLQNEGELRSTGGWISSYALIGLEGGQIRQLFVDDAYNVDGQLINLGKNYNAPAEMATALDIEKWTFSLSNWYPEISSSATNLEFFLKEADKAYKIDGVIFVNTNIIRDLISYWGSIDIIYSQGQTPTQSQDTITTENLNDKIFQMHKSYTPGSSLKSDFMLKLADASINKLLEEPLTNLPEISSILQESLDKKDVMIYLKQVQPSSYISSKGWDGNITSSKTTAPIAIDWNWGGNKANLFIEKNAGLTVRIDPNQTVTYNYELSITNNSQSNVYPEGQYKNYLRVYIPKDAKLTTVSGFNQNDYTTYFEGKYKVIGGMINVPIKSASNINIQYELNGQNAFIQTGKTLSLAVDILKQSGDIDQNYNLSVFYPSSWSLQSYESDLQLNEFNSSVASQFTLDRDKRNNLIFDLK